MRTKFFLKEIALVTIFSALAYFNITFWHNAFLGWLVLSVFCLYEGKTVHNFLIKFYGLSSSLRIFVLSLFLVLAILGSIGGFLFWVFSFSPFILGVAFLVSGLIFGFLKGVTGPTVESEAEINDLKKQVLEEPPSAKVGLLLYFILIFIGFYLLNSSKTSLVVSTPWSTIASSYIYVFFAATFILGLLIFSKLKSGTILFLLIVHTFLLHAYLPLTHSLFYGADGWRHIASQNSLWLHGDYLKPQLNNTTNFWQNIDFGEMAYAQFNTLALLFKSLCQVDLLSFIRYFIPQIWSIIFPIVLFEIARALNFDKKNALFLVWVSSLPFALQVSGNFTLPANLSFLFLASALLLMFKNQDSFSWPGLYFIIFLGTVFLFGHSLYFILFWLAFFVLKIIHFFNNNKIINFSLLFLVTLCIPAIELLSKFSQINLNIEWWSSFKTILGTLFGWYLAVGPRTSDITVGNIILNQPPLSSLVVNAFTYNRFWLVGIMLIFWSLFVWVSFSWWRQRDAKRHFWVIFSGGLLGGYLISRYFLTGENILSRRLDVVLALLIIVLVANFLYKIVLWPSNPLSKYLVIFLLIFCISASTAASYSLGPDTESVSKEGYEAMNFVWHKEKDNEKICVLSDTYPLLVLEALSAKRFVGGGFPITSFFAQPQREQLLKLAKTDPQSALYEAENLTNLKNCYLVGKYNLARPLFVSEFKNFNVYKLNQ